MPQSVYLTEDIILAVVKEAMTHGWTMQDGMFTAPKDDIRLNWCSEWIKCETLDIRVPMYLFCGKKGEGKNYRTVFFTQDGSEIIRGGKF